MKSKKLILSLVIVLLVILSSNVMASVTREDFESAINSFVNGMCTYSNRFVYTEDSNTNVIYLGYTNQTVNTSGNTMLFFSDDSFIAYIYHEVLGLNLSDGKKVYEQIDIYKDIQNNNDAKFNYFNNISNGDWYLSKEWTKYKDQIKPGDILIETNGMSYWGTCGMYIGGGKVVMFTSDGLKTYNLNDATERKLLDGKGFDVARINDTQLNNASTLNYTFDTNKINVNAMTVADAINNLQLEITIDDDGLVFKNTNGNNVSLADIVFAIRMGYQSEYLKNLSGIYIMLEYKDDGGNMRPLYIIDHTSTNVYGYEFESLSIHDNDDSNILKFNKLPSISNLNLAKYESEMYSYWGVDYIAQSNHSLYCGIYIDGETSYRKIGKSMAIANGKETNGAIECFSALVDEDDLGEKPTLQDFLDVDLELPDYVYELDFSTSNFQTINHNKLGKYEKNTRNEILFTVNKSGTYAVKITLGNTGEVVKTVIMHTTNYDNYKKEFFGFDDGEMYSTTLASSIYLKNAGREIEVYCEDTSCTGKNHKNGEYIEKYEKMAFPFIKEKIYVLSPEQTISNINDIDKCTFEIEYIDDGLTEILDHKTALDTYTSQSAFGVKEVHINGEKKLTVFERLEFLMSFCVRNIANVLVLMMDNALGWIDENNVKNTVSIDTIIFDKYPLTKLNLFTQSLKPGEQQNSFIKSFAENINTWFYNFTLIAVVAYLIILLYMGIRIVIGSTAAKKALYQELFVHWVTGVAILFLFPLVIKYAIQINSEFVAMVCNYVEKQGTQTIDSSTNTIDYEDPDENSDLSTDDKVSEETKQMELNPFDANDKGYMAIMSRRAHTTKRLSYALVYLIMSFQLVIIAVMYYKRLFMVAFLIVIFPIVMIAHVLEKVADVKIGGAFSKWTKEILITIFIQSIHAIIYSFASATVLAAGDSNNDWILMIVGVSFLFNGENILKKILGYDSQTTPSLAQTAVKTAATVALTKKAVTSIADNVVGSGSHLNMAIKYGREAKKAKLKAENIDVLGVKPREYKIPSADKLEHYDSMYDSDPEARELGNAIQVLNHSNLVTDTTKLRNAIETIERAKTNGKYNTLLKDLKMSDKTFKSLQDARNNAAADAVSGKKTKQQIDMELTMELERILPEQSVKAMKLALYSQMGSAMSRSIIGARSTNEDDVKKEISDARERYGKLKSKINIASESSISKEDKELEKNAAKLLRGIYGKNARLTKEQYKMALSVCMLRDASSGKYDANELMASANFAFKNQLNDNNFARMTSYVGVGLDEYRYAIAEAVCEKGYGKVTTKERAWRIKGNNVKPLNKNLTKTCEIARDILDSTEERLSDREHEKKENGKLDNKEEEKREEQELYEMSDVISIVDVNIMDQEQARLGTSEETQILQIIDKRKKKNTDEKSILIGFASQMISENNDIYKKKIDGMTRDELLEAQNIAARKKAKEIGRTLQTTTATIVGAPIGAGMAIGLSDDDDTLKEAITGALAGAATLDTVVEHAYDETKHKRKVKVRNPYTGEMEVVEVTTSGAFSDAEVAAMLSSEASSTMSSKLKEQFLQNKINREKQFEDMKIAKQQKEEHKKRLEEAYKKAITETAQKRNNQNNS